MDVNVSGILPMTSFRTSVSATLGCLAERNVFRSQNRFPNYSDSATNGPKPRKMCELRVRTAVRFLLFEKSLPAVLSHNVCPLLAVTFSHTVVKINVSDL
jgi:hypothetical protein